MTSTFRLCKAVEGSCPHLYSRDDDHGLIHQSLDETLSVFGEDPPTHHYAAHMDYDLALIGEPSLCNSNEQRPLTSFSTHPFRLGQATNR
jgi:hypothetical protein